MQPKFKSKSWVWRLGLLSCSGRKEEVSGRLDFRQVGDVKDRSTGEMLETQMQIQELIPWKQELTLWAPTRR